MQRVDEETKPRFTPGPWKVRAGTFCEGDGIPSYEVVMPGKPVLNAVDARLIGAAPTLYEAVIDLLSAMEMQEQREIETFHVSQREARFIWDKAKATARAALTLVSTQVTSVTGDNKCSLETSGV